MADSPAQVAKPRERKAMAAWFDPLLLLKTGIRTVVSSVFGEFADKREAIAAANAMEPAPADGEFDYSARHGGGDFWFDYLADTGDGWNPTYAMARLVTQNVVAVRDGDETLSLPRGRLLILGGDQVYPTASLEEYRDRLIAPFDEAWKLCGSPLRPDDAGSRPHLYAIPGNHDWYDGLRSFFSLFCRRRVVRGAVDLGVSRPGKVIGGRQTQQTRSYFAIELPGNWWVWGTDSQLAGYIDQPQIDYFIHAATYWMKPGSKLILCVADPSWAYVDPKNVEKRFESFSYLERLAASAVAPANPHRRDTDPPGRWPSAGAPMGHELRLVLTGDSHHYCRYEEGGRPYIVCGGGGAFLHPTHQLRDKIFDARFPPPGSPAHAPLPNGLFRRHFRIAGTEGNEAVYPSKKTSRRLSWGNLAFVWKNKSFVTLLAGLYFVFHWILDFNGRAIGAEKTLAGELRAGSFAASLSAYWSLIVSSPWGVIMILFAWLGYVNFADSPHSRWGRRAMGTAHAALQATAVTVATCAAIRALPAGWLGGWNDIASVLLAAVSGGVASGILFGLYLLVSIGLLGRHANEGFSSMAIEGHKSFLRLHIDADAGLTIYPIGLRDVPKDDGPVLRNPKLEPELIERPIPLP